MGSWVLVSAGCVAWLMTKMAQSIKIHANEVTPWTLTMLSEDLVIPFKALVDLQGRKKGWFTDYLS